MPRPKLLTGFVRRSFVPSLGVHNSSLLGSLCRGVALSGVVLLAGCSQQLYGALDESAANQVVGALRNDGIGAEKSRSGDELWKVTVPDDEFARAVQLLKRRNLPPQPFDGLGRVFKKDSLVSTPTEERARLIHAMAQELERSLMEIDGVLVARVHPVIPPHDPLNPKKVGSTASVLVKYRQGSDIASREGMIRSLVASGVEGLAYEDVRVLLVSAETQSAVVEKPTLSRSVPPVFWGILGVLLAVLLIAYFVISWRDRAVIGVDNLRSRLIRNQRSEKAQPKKKVG
jgi:type III secretion protein J